jgi:hypothetical protein
MNHSTAPSNSLVREYVDLARFHPVVSAALLVFPSYFAHLPFWSFDFTNGKRHVVSESVLLSRRHFPSQVPFVAIV